MSIPTTPILPEPTLPKFQRNDCFNLNGIREEWEPSPDGIVAMVGKAKYLLMHRYEAERRVGVGGTKAAIPQTIETFDASHYKVDCPKEWRTHGHRATKH